ncbi:hypothetical protein TWF281_010369 [Arthrobotrys megalospora]
MYHYQDGTQEPIQYVWIAGEPFPNGPPTHSPGPIQPVNVRETPRRISSAFRNLNVPQLPNEIMHMILITFNDEVETGNCLDDTAIRYTVLSFRRVCHTWNALVLHAFFRHTRLTCGYFPPIFNPLKSVTGTRVLDAGGQHEARARSRLDQNVRHLNRSNFFLNFLPHSLLGVRVLTAEISCTVDDVEPTDVITMHKDFAIAARNCVNVETITLNCHGMCRLDDSENGLDAWLTCWNWDIITEPVLRDEIDADFDYEFGFFGKRPVMTGPRITHKPPGPIFPKLKELNINGFTTSTTISDTGASDLLSFLIRHRKTLETISFKNFGRRDASNRPTAPISDVVDTGEAFIFWVQFRAEIIRQCTNLKKLTMNSMSYTILRQGPVPGQPPAPAHGSQHNSDWAYETELWVSYVERDQNFVMYQRVRACACQPVVFSDPETSEGPGMDIYRATGIKTTGQRLRLANAAASW